MTPKKRVKEKREGAPIPIKNTTPHQSYGF